MSGKQVKKLLGKLKKPEFQGSDDYGSKYWWWYSGIRILMRCGRLSWRRDKLPMRLIMLWGIWALGSIRGISIGKSRIPPTMGC